jgi:hypothetical protein
MDIASQIDSNQIPVGMMIGDLVTRGLGRKPQHRDLRTSNRSDLRASSNALKQRLDSSKISSFHTNPHGNRPDRAKTNPFSPS